VVARFTDWGIKVLIPASALVTYHMTRWLGNEVVEETLELPDGATATPLRLSPAEQRQFMDDMGNYLEQARDAEGRY